jgi:hypothetical protein
VIFSLIVWIHCSALGPSYFSILSPRINKTHGTCVISSRLSTNMRFRMFSLSTHSRLTLIGTGLDSNEFIKAVECLEYLLYKIMQVYWLIFFESCILMFKYLDGSTVFLVYATPGSKVFLQHTIVVNQIQNDWDAVGCPEYPSKILNEIFFHVCC